MPTRILSLGILGGVIDPEPSHKRARTLYNKSMGYVYNDMYLFRVFLGR